MEHLTWDQIKDKLKAEQAFLDTLDLESDLKEHAHDGWDVDDFVRYIEDKYISEYNKLYPDADFILNWTTNSEFADYIEKRYGITTREEVKYYFNM